jgi:hypothetical protein
MLKRTIDLITDPKHRGIYELHTNNNGDEYMIRRIVIDGDLCTFPVPKGSLYDYVMSK